MFGVSKGDQRWRNLPLIPLHIPRLRITRTIIYIAGSALLFFSLLFYSSSYSPPKEGLAPNIPVPESEDLGLPPPFDPSESNFHVLVTGTTPNNPQLCRTITSGMILDYPSMTLLKPKSVSDKKKFQYKTVLEKVETVLDFLKTNKRAGDRDLILIVDSDDTLFQLPSNILIKRYGELMQKKNEQLRKKYGMRVVGNDDDEGPRRLVQKYTQKVLFASRKDCSSNLTDSSDCASVPESPLPPDVYGPKTDEQRDGTKNRPRWIDSSIVMGQKSDLIPLYERVLKELEKQHVTDQMAFTHIFGAQEYSREFERRKTSSPFNEWLWDFMGISEASNITNVRTRIQPGSRLEYGIGLDYEGQLFLNTRKTIGDIEWIRFRDIAKVSSTQFLHGVPREKRLRLPLDIEKNASNPFEKTNALKPSIKTWNMTRLDVVPPAWNFTWYDLPLATFVQTGAVPAIIHTTRDGGVRQSFWDKLWFHPWSRALLRKHILSEDVEAVQQISALGASDLLKSPDRKGGMWADNDEWISFGDLCSGTEGALFDDKSGTWGEELPNPFHTVYDLWGRLLLGKGPKTIKLGELRTERETIERLVYGIEEDEEEDEEDEEEQ